MPNGEPILMVLAWLGTYLVHSTLLLGAVWMLTRWRVLRSPRLAERTWKLALLGGLLTASLQLAIGAEPFLGGLALETVPGTEPVTVQVVSEPELRPTPGAPRRVAADAGRQTAPSATFPGPDAPPRARPTVAAPGLARSTHSLASEARASRAPSATEETRRAARREVRFGPNPTETPRAQPGLEAPFAAARLVPPPEERERPDAFRGLTAALRAAPEATWRGVLLGAWGLVATIGLVGILWAWTRFFAQLSDRREIVRGPLADRLTHLCQLAGIRRRIRLTASPSIESPLTCGWIRREICIPTRAITDLSAGQQDAMLAHELAHACRRDPAWFSLFALLERALFFQPLNRLARRELQVLAELQCDDWAVRWTGGRIALASCLTEIAQWIVGRRNLALPAAGMAERPSQLGQRVERLLDDRRSPTPEPGHPWWSPTAVGALGLFVFAVPGVTSARAQVPPEEAPPAFPALEAAPAQTTTSMPYGLLVDHELLENELTLLERELTVLREELGDTRLLGRFERVLDELQRKVDVLRERKARLNVLMLLILNDTEETGPDRIPQERLP